MSWAAVDFAEHRKPLWYALRLAYQPRLVTIQPSPDGGDATALHLVLVNDTEEAWTGAIRLQRQDFDGTAAATIGITLDLPPRSVSRHAIPAEIAGAERAAEQIIVATTEDGMGRAIWNYVEPVEQQLHPDPIVVQAIPTDSGARITVTARSYCATSLCWRIARMRPPRSTSRS